MMKRAIGLVTGLLLVVPAAASAQVSWDSPYPMGPGLTDGMSVQLVDPWPGSNVGAMVTWRRSRVPGGLGFRVGVADGFAGDLAGFGGIQASGMLMHSDEQFPLDLSWATGAGLSVGRFALVSFPLGLYAGRSFQGEQVRFIPFIGPRLDLDAYMGSNRPERRGNDQLDLAFSADLGGDIVFDRLGVRFAASVGDHDALSIGLVFPGVH